jgi:hypothetical protein
VCVFRVCVVYAQQSVSSAYVACLCVVLCVCAGVSDKVNQFCVVGYTSLGLVRYLCMFLSVFLGCIH